jgi:hypothetical protein
VNSPVTIQQMKTFVKTRTDGGTVRIDHEPGHHDDSLFALGIADFVSQEQAAVYLAREAARLGEPDLEPKQKIDYQSTGMAVVDGKLTVITPGFLRGEDESSTYSYELPS